MSRIDGLVDASIKEYRKFQKHPELFQAKSVGGQGWQEEWFNDRFVAVKTALTDAEKTTECSTINEFVKRECDDIYSFPFLSERTCELILEEMENYTASGLPTFRPNSMNKYGGVAIVCQHIHNI